MSYAVISNEEIVRNVRLVDRTGRPTSLHKVETYPIGTAYKSGMKKDTATRYADKLKTMHKRNVSVVANYHGAVIYR